MKNYTKLKIGMVIDDSLDRTNNGVQQYVLTLGSWLESQGHVVHYLTSGAKHSSPTVHRLSRNIGVAFNKNRMTIPLPASKKRIKRLLAEQNYDVLHVQMPYSPFMAGKVISAAHDTAAVVGTFHIVPYGGLQKIGSKTLAMAQNASLKRFDAICSVSSVAASFAKSHFGIKSIVIPNMIDIAKWHSKLSPHPKRIVYLGRLVPRKGCQQLLNALIKMPKQLIDELEVIIASDGPQRAALEKFVIKNKLSCVKFIGFIDEKDKPNLLASAEIAVFPSLGGESFGIVLIEAMAAGAGVVLGGNNVGYASVLGHIPQTLINPNNPEEFAAKLSGFISDATQRNAVHYQQQQTVIQYDVNVAGTKIIDMYRTALLHTRKDVP